MEDFSDLIRERSVFKNKLYESLLEGLAIPSKIHIFSEHLFPLDGVL